MTRTGRLYQIGLAACLALATLAFGPPADADEKTALAQEFFDAGMNLAQQGNYAAACPKFQESLRLDPQIPTLFYLADCQEHIELRASAWGNFVVVADKAAAANKPAHAREAQARADALKGRLNKLVILVSDEVLKTPGLEIRRGEILLGPAQFGVALPIDNGKHVIKVSATNRRAWSSVVEIAGESSTMTISIPPLKEEPVLGPVAPAASSTHVMAPPDAGWSAPRKAAIGLGAAGVAGLVLGGVFGGLMADKVGSSNKLCTPGAVGAPDTCPPEGARLREEANTFANVANVGVIAGATLAVAGAVIWLVAPATDKPAKAKGNTRLAITTGAQGGMVHIETEW